uniref:Uncharacterized protein n=1 Tax=Pseudictyota dubia TaxID=2749911 RepID=A0A7R9VW40_9STRA|mmetsp:Transcript_24483/g.45264  ORF Transcript_24483/g.45264 Transcript_24483/m.45264 type:complete len:126 (+) Transcript_24483:61-438(+)
MRFLIKPIRAGTAGLALFRSAAPRTCGAFVPARPPSSATRGLARPLSSFSRKSVELYGDSNGENDVAGAPCDVDSALQVPDLVSAPGSADVLRSALLTNADGESVRLGDAMGSGTSIVVFLRHLA